ncbi:MAG: S26 family signal peptidase [Candidatus Saccharimonadales bacterium]
MLPSLKHGQLVVSTISGRSLDVGDVVVFVHNKTAKIKRIAMLDDHKMYVLGDNGTSSSDSRQYGWFDRKLVTGKIVWPRN